MTKVELFEKEKFQIKLSTCVTWTVQTGLFMALFFSSYGVNPGRLGWPVKFDDWSQAVLWDFVVWMDLIFFTGIFLERSVRRMIYLWLLMIPLSLYVWFWIFLVWGLRSMAG